MAPAGMAARFATIDHGDITTTGNALLTCPASDPSCAAAQTRTGARLDDDDFTMVAVDVDADLSTGASSAAGLSLPARREVLSAQLYYGADLAGGEGGQPASATSDAAVGTSVVESPAGSRSTVVAERIDRIGTRYQAVADVTALVRAGGSGRWTVGGVQAGTGRGAYGGWSLVVAYRSSAAPLRSLVVLDGLTSLTAGASTSFEVGGLGVARRGPPSATISVVTYEGDAGLAGDQLTVAGQAVVDPANPAGNTFNASASDAGSPGGGRDPGFANLFGFDVDRFAVGPLLAPGSTRAAIGFTTGADVYLPGAVALTVDR